MTMEQAACSRLKCSGYSKQLVTSQKGPSGLCYSPTKKTVYGEVRNMRRRLKQKAKSIILPSKVTQAVSRREVSDLLFPQTGCRKSGNGFRYLYLMVFTNSM